MSSNVLEITRRMKKKKYPDQKYTLMIWQYWWIQMFQSYMKSGNKSKHFHLNNFLKVQNCRSYILCFTFFLFVFFTLVTLIYFFSFFNFVVFIYFLIAFLFCFLFLFLLFFLFVLFFLVTFILFCFVFHFPLFLSFVFHLYCCF